MPRPKNRRSHQQGIDFIVGALRRLTKHSKASPLTILRVIDRLAKIDGVYEVPLGEAGYYPPRMIPPTIERQEPKEEMSEEEARLDDKVRELMGALREGELNDTTTSEDSVPTDSEGTDSGLC